VNRYIDPLTKQVHIAKVWNDHSPLTDAFLSIFFMAWVHFSISGLPMIAEIYKKMANIWYDPVLWQLEKSLLQGIQISVLPLIPIATWDIIYLSMWIFLVGVIAALMVAKQDHKAAEMTTATVLMFYFTHIIALFFPTTGPAMYQPNDFQLDGTTSLVLQNMLTTYQHGKTPQNGLLYGTVGMPSLHVALTYLAGYFLVNLHRRLWLPTLLWLVATWMSTVILGWHYILDGVVGILIAMSSIVIVRWLVAQIDLVAKSRKMGLTS
jgi:membrane-associated phospholipid phosphatase